MIGQRYGNLHRDGAAQTENEKKATLSKEQKPKATITKVYPWFVFTEFAKVLLIYFTFFISRFPEANISWKYLKIIKCQLGHNKLSFNSA